MTCPSCHGEKLITAFVHYLDAECTGLQRIACTDCKGSGEVPDERKQWMAEGRLRRKDRIARGMKLGDEAKRLWIRPAELSDMEHGRRPFPKNSVEEGEC